MPITVEHQPQFAPLGAIAYGAGQQQTRQWIREQAQRDADREFRARMAEAQMQASVDRVQFEAQSRYGAAVATSENRMAIQQAIVTAQQDKQRQEQMHDTRNQLTGSIKDFASSLASGAMTLDPTLRRDFQQLKQARFSLLTNPRFSKHADQALPEIEKRMTDIMQQAAPRVEPTAQDMFDKNSVDMGGGRVIVFGPDGVPRQFLGPKETPQPTEFEIAETTAKLALEFHRNQVADESGNVRYTPEEAFAMMQRMLGATPQGRHQALFDELRQQDQARGGAPQIDTPVQAAMALISVAPEKAEEAIRELRLSPQEAAEVRAAVQQFQAQQFPEQEHPAKPFDETLAGRAVDQGILSSLVNAAGKMVVTAAKGIAGIVLSETVLEVIQGLPNMPEEYIRRLVFEAAKLKREIPQEWSYDDFDAKLGKKSILLSRKDRPLQREYLPVGLTR